MKIQVIRKKASSLRELGHEEMEVGEVSTLRELLCAVARVEFEKQHGGQRDSLGMEDGKNCEAVVDGRRRHQFEAGTVPRVLYADEEELRHQGRLGKVQFGESYDERPGDWERALETLYQDFEDGLYRVYIDGTEYTELSQPLALSENAQVVFIRLVMLSGRLW